MPTSSRTLIAFVIGILAVSLALAGTAGAIGGPPADSNTPFGKPDRIAQSTSNATIAQKGFQITRGTFAPVPGFSDYGISGTAQMVRTPGKTIVKIRVSGLKPGQTYAAHVHNAPCSSGGGSHYQHVSGSADEANEIWLRSANSSDGIKANAAGKARGNGTAAWVARADAQAVVIHHYGDSKVRVACAQLS
jgi:hypothetical protein